MAAPVRRTVVCLVAAVLVLLPAATARRTISVGSMSSSEGASLGQRSQQPISNPASRASLRPDFPHIVVKGLALEAGKSSVSVSKQRHTLAEDEVQAAILGGTDAAKFRYLWMVSLRYNSGANSHFCGGTLINYRMVLTAAHCFFKTIKNTDNTTTDVLDDDKTLFPKVWLGLYIKKETDPTKYEEREGISVVIHKLYDPNGPSTHDIAIIYLNKAVSSRYVPIKLPLAFEGQVAAGTLLTTIGWGRNNADETTEPTVLQEVQVDVVDTLRSALLKPSCKKQFTDAGRTLFVPQMMCAGTPSKRKNSCGGDSGGPLFLPSPNGSPAQDLQYGITSFGVGDCGTTSLPGVYTNISTYRNWIDQNMVILNDPVLMSPFDGVGLYKVILSSNTRQCKTGRGHAYANSCTIADPTLFLAHKGITGSINQHIILSTTTDNKWTLRKESVEGGGCSKYLALFAQNTGTAAPADPCNVETVPPQLGSEFTYGTPLPYVFALPDSLLKSNGGPWEDEWISTGLTRVEKGAMNIIVCANDATWQPARATAAANSGYTAAWQALGGPSFVFDTSQVTPKGSFTPGKMFGTALNSLIYNPDSPMWGTNSTNLTCAWWFPTSPLAALKPAGLDRYWGVRISIPAKATKWPLLLFMLSDADPSRFSFGACL
ncbi:hypothetical protein CHLNCDRAFT_53640 [Chlorella variabilis]|uniref:Peptidase S1 domain-containing protein n=1 Tax=Chlorella variabilis TaxID=554065 RepID=E1ZKJ5_CHLVA|nr:hypothetical protein CHLNCDRAFT_53640 [Chlorella variabilis]EFN53705.1 hypothetical protein CHLNCDRAFT_53640 [Chlorella variabilis]|eukprot:XP_005845807.1 hypothetical protein CHLNCDRAFT_53640 [Chlorella variabilis]